MNKQHVQMSECTFLKIKKRQKKPTLHQSLGHFMGQTINIGLYKDNRLQM